MEHSNVANDGCCEVCSPNVLQDPIVAQLVKKKIVVQPPPPFDRGIWTMEPPNCPFIHPKMFLKYSTHTCTS